MTTPAGPVTAPTVFVTEIFSAIQGEGALVGERQVFVRLAGCNIRCGYCDQPEALERAPGPCRIERSPGERDWQVVDSPFAVEAAAGAADRLWRALPHHSVSLTGGEPLFQRAAPALAAALAERGHRLYLETNGMLVGALERIAPFLSHVSMDLKLPSVDGEAVSPSAQQRFLAVAAASVPHVFCKIVVVGGTDRAELAGAVAMVAATAPAAEVFLQPVTPFGSVTSAPDAGEVLELHALALRVHPRVRVVPQTHKAIGQL